MQSSYVAKNKKYFQKYLHSISISKCDTEEDKKNVKEFMCGKKKILITGSGESGFTLHLNASLVNSYDSVNSWEDVPFVAFNLHFHHSSRSSNNLILMSLVL